MGYFLSVGFKKSSFLCKLSFNTTLMGYLDFVWNLWMLYIIFYLNLWLKYDVKYFNFFCKYPHVHMDIHGY